MGDSRVGSILTSLPCEMATFAFLVHLVHDYGEQWSHGTSEMNFNLIELPFVFYLDLRLGLGILFNDQIMNFWVD